MTEIPVRPRRTQTKGTNLARTMAILAPMCTMPSLVNVRRNPWIWLLIAAFVVHVLMMGSLFWGYLNPLFSISDKAPQAIDFFSIYEAGNRALHNESVYFGDPALSPVTPHFMFYRYLPMFAYGFAVPANALPPWPAYWAWVAFYELLLVANAYATWRIAENRKWGLIGASMWFVFTPFYLEQYMGQFSFLMATGLFWTGMGIARGREAIAGPPWVVSLVVKSNSAVLLPLFLRLNWWRSVAAGVALVGMNGLYFLFRGRDLRFFYDANIKGIYTSPLDRPFNDDPGLMGLVDFVRNSIMTLDSTASGVHAATPISIIAVVACLSIAATFLTRNPDRVALFGIWLSTYFLVYGVWEAHYVMYLPVVVLLVAQRPSARPWALLAFAFVALPTPYWLLSNVWNTGPLPPTGSFFSIQEAWPAWGVVFYHAAKPVPVLALWGYLVFQELRNGVRIPAIRAK